MLDSLGQKRLCHFIINRELSVEEDWRITPPRLYDLACQIKKVFPTEHVSTYFVPYGGKATKARGKLWDRLCNRRRDFRKAGLIPKKRVWPPSSPDDLSST